METAASGSHNLNVSLKPTTVCAVCIIHLHNYILNNNIIT